MLVLFCAVAVVEFDFLAWLTEEDVFVFGATVFDLAIVLCMLLDVFCVV